MKVGARDLAVVAGVWMVVALAISPLTTGINRGEHASAVHLRAGGAFAAAGDLMWLRVAERIPFAERVPPKEAEANYRRLLVAARLNPDNREPYRYGPLGLALWGRPDLGLRLLSEGLRRDSQDATIRTGLFAITADTSDIDYKQVMEALKPIILQDPSDPLPHLMLAWEARREEDAGRLVEAIATWTRIRDGAGRNVILRSRAKREIARLTTKLESGSGSN
jgi:hypothetical protein